MIETADELVTYIKDFTGSQNDDEIKQCIFLAEMMMRNIELPALRTDPYTTIGVADANGYVPIPPDMNRPILFFNQGTPGNTGALAGPWIVYDRIGDRDMITMQLVENLYLNPVNIPQVFRGKFSEVGQVYQFLPGLGGGAQINMYYFKAWPELFTPIPNEIVSAAGTISTVTGSGPWTVTITGLSDTNGLSQGIEVTATAGTGSLGTGTAVISSIVSSTSVTITVTGGTAPTTGTITNLTVINQTLQTNVVLQSFPEGYVYGTLHNYYYKRKMTDDADKWLAKYNLAYDTVEDQNNKGKWSGGHNRLTSIFQPRVSRRFGTR